jgi:UDP:flavonoid glycosyltransferase YjiC (YdhE family)
MGRIVWACWDGGGNLPPGLGIANALGSRGHDVLFYGRPEMVPRAEAAGVRARAFGRARSDLDRYSFHPLATVFGYTSSPAVGEELADTVAAEDPDLVVIDAMFAAALNVAPRFGRPTAVMLHTFCYRLVDMWRANVAMQSQSRQRAGFDALPTLDELWGERDLLHVNTLAALDGEPTVDWSHVVHGAPVLTSERRAVPAALPWADDDPVPVVLLSFSTVTEQRDPAMLQRALDALAPLPVHVVATTGGIVEPAELSAPANAWLTSFADHEQLLERAAVVLGHGGHGTMMRALRHGVPVVGIPAKGGDQEPNTRLIEEWGAGLALPPDTDELRIRAAVQEVLASDRFAAEARRRSRAFGARDGADLAADSIEALLSSQAGVPGTAPARQAPSGRSAWLAQPTHKSV